VALTDPITIAVHVGGILEAVGVRHTIGGSLAASFAGEPRSTIDIDFVAALTHDKVTPLMAALGRERYLAGNAPAIEVEDVLERAIQEAS
jgi:hypothetical protein